MDLKKIIIGLTVFLILFLIPFLGASASNGYSVSGYVSDNYGLGLEGVLVKNGSYSDTTSADGYYVIDGLPEGTYRFRYSRSGFNTGYLEVTIRDKDHKNANITIYDTTPPGSIRELVSDTPARTTVNLSWNPVRDSDNYLVFRNSTSIGSTRNSYWNDTGLTPDTPYRYFVRAIDSYNNSGRRSPTLSIRTAPDTTSPDLVSSSDTTSPDLESSSDTTSPDLVSSPDTTSPDLESSPDTTSPDLESSSDTTSPASVSNPRTTTGNFYINNTWTNPEDTYLSHIWFRYKSGGTLQNVSAPVNYLNLTWRPHYKQNISAQTVDIYGNVNPTKIWFNATIPNNPITITNTSDWSGKEGQTVYLDFDYEDADDDTGIFTTSATKGTLDKWTGVFKWTTQKGDEGTYYWVFRVRDRYESVSEYPATITVRGDNATGDNATGDNATGDNTTGDNTTGNTTGDNATGDNVTGDDTIGDNVTGNNATFEPGEPRKPENLQNSTGNFWVSYTWEKGANTDSFNVSFNDRWSNGSSETFTNHTVGPHGWGNITVYGWNSTFNVLGPGISQDTQVPNNPPNQSIIGDKVVYTGQTLDLRINTTDADSDPITYGTNATKGSLNSSTGVYNWTTDESDTGMYIWEFNSSDGYGGVASETINVTVNNPLDIDLKFIEPYVINHNETWVKTWRDAEVGHEGKFIGIDGTFNNTGNDSLVLTVTEIHGNESRGPFTSILEKNESKSYMQAFGRPAFPINSTEIKDGFFNFTLKVNIRGQQNGTWTSNYTNTTSISLPIIPILKIKQANTDTIVVSEGRTTTVTYTLEASSTINLTNVSIYDPLYPENQGYFNVSKLEANIPSNISYSYPATTSDLSKFKCEGSYSCIINLATFTGETESGVKISDTDYIELYVCKDTDTNCFPSGTVTGSESGGSGGSSGSGGDGSSGEGGSGSSGGGGGGGGGGMPPSEDFNNMERREVREMDIPARSSPAYVFNAADPVMVVAFESSVSENGVPVAVEVLRNRSKYIGVDAPGKLYNYFNIFVGMSGFSKKVSKGVVAYRVDNSWLEENDLDPKDISLYKWEGKWVKKNTEIVESKQNYTYYAGLVGNFSSFAITGIKKQEVTVQEVTSGSMPEISVPSDESTEDTTQTSDDLNPQDVKPIKRNLQLSVILIVIFGIIGIIYYLKMLR